jgi:hypothetical protein
MRLQVVVAPAERPEVGSCRGTAGPRHGVVEIAPGGWLSAPREAAVRLAGADQAGKPGTGHVAPGTGGRDDPGRVGDPGSPAPVGGELASDISRHRADSPDLGWVV